MHRKTTSESGSTVFTTFAKLFIFANDEKTLLTPGSTWKTWT